MAGTQALITKVLKDAEASVAQSQGDDLTSSMAMTTEEEYKKLLELRSGGTYVPPARLRALIEKINFEKGSKEAQIMRWEKLKKNINGLINKANKSNLKSIVIDLFKLNLTRGQGLLVRSLMKAQSQALPFTAIYASLVSVLNSKIPQIGELLIARLVLQFKKAYKRNNKTLCISSTTFLSQLANQQVLHEVLILQILHLLLNNPTDDSVDIAVSILKNTGLLLSEVSNNAVTVIFEKLRYILLECKVEKRTQYMVEVLFQIRRSGYVNYPVVPEELDLVEEDDILTHKVSLDDKLQAHDVLNIFRFDENYEENEKEYTRIKAEILGEDNEKDEEDEEEEYTDTEGEYEIVEEEGNNQEEEQTEQETKIEIKDMTGTNLTNFRKTIYLILKGSMSADEAVHKLLKQQVKDQDMKYVVDIIVKVCSQENTYSKYYGVTGEKLCGQNKFWAQEFVELFKKNYKEIHRYESNPLRNVSKFWGHLLSSDAFSWEALEVVNLTENDTSSAGRIFIKFIFQELVEELGIPHIKERLSEEYMQPFLKGLFPSEDTDHIRFSINYFTAIGLGTLTDGMRESLQMLLNRKEEEEINRGRSRSRSSSRSSFYSGSYSRSYSRSRPYSRSRSHSRGRSYSRYASRRRCSRSPSYSRSPPKKNYSVSPSYPRSPRRRGYSRSRSPSRSPSKSTRNQDSRRNSRSPVIRRSYSSSPRSRSIPPRSFSRSSHGDRLRYSDYNRDNYKPRGNYRSRGSRNYRGFNSRGRGRGTGFKVENYRGNSNDRHYEPTK